MRLIPALVALMLILACAACGGGSSSRASTPSATRTVATGSATSAVRPTPASSAEAEDRTPVAPGDQVEVTGVVGTITTDPRVIEITRLSGAAVNRIEIGDATVIREAGGGRIELAGVHTSDRIIADGQINDRGDGLIADEVTVQPVVPGAAPGG